MGSFGLGLGVELVLDTEEAIGICIGKDGDIKNDLGFSYRG